MKISLFLIITSLLFCKLPYSISLKDNSSAREVEDGLSSNGIYDIEIYDDSNLFMGSSNGLNIAYYDDEDNIVFKYFIDSDLPEGGNPALVVSNNVIVVSGVKSVNTPIGTQSKGTGVSYSLDGGNSWNFMPQPTDKNNQLDPSYVNKWACPWGPFNASALYDSQFDCNSNCLDCVQNQSNCMMYDYIEWGEQDSILNFSVTTDIQNVSYGVAVLGDYIYAASWAGSLRRFNYMNQEPHWEVVPLPMDNQDFITCGQIDESIYQINPVGNYVDNYDCGYEFDNHKVFSVFSNEDTLWVGTANGINKGIVGIDSCIDWEHYTSDQYGFYDDWVIGFENQLLEDGTTNRLWAITWDRQYSGSHEFYGGPPSYTDDGGQTWHVVEEFDSKDLLTYNISSTLEKIYISSDQGLFFTTNYSEVNLWDELILPSAISTQSVFDSEYLEDENHLFVGTGQGVCVYDGATFSCESSNSDISNTFYAYPNPFDFNNTNQLTFVYDNDESNLDGEIEIYDIAMDRVVKINASGISRWNGNNEFGDRVSNGLYICKYKHQNGNTYLFNIIVVN